MAACWCRPLFPGCSPLPRAECVSRMPTPIDTVITSAPAPLISATFPARAAGAEPAPHADSRGLQASCHQSTVMCMCSCITIPLSKIADTTSWQVLAAPMISTLQLKPGTHSPIDAVSSPAVASPPHRASSRYVPRHHISPLVSCTIARSPHAYQKEWD